MYWRTTKLSRVKGHLGYAGRDMLVPSITIIKINEEVLGNSNIGWFIYNKKQVPNENYRILRLEQFFYSCEIFTDQHHVLMSNMVKNGVNPVIVKRETCVLIVTLEQNNNFIQRFIKVPNVTTYNSQDIVQEASFAHSLM